MNRIILIAIREFMAIVRSPLGFIVAALFLFLLGLDFHLRVLGGSQKYSSDVLASFFYDLSGFVICLCVLTSMGLLARERESGTIVLLLTSPVKDSQIVLGKFLGALTFLVVLCLLTLYMPLLIMANGKVSVGHVVSGYTGVLLLGCAVLSIGTFASSLTRYQFVAVLVSLGIGIPLILLWLAGRFADPPLNEIFAYMALHSIHFSPFKNGKIELSNIVYYLSVSAFFLFAASRILESRRWR
jgi:ABC-2 type transport system permease protein